ncbi:MAG TPA: hypothetical protein VEU74_11910 [Gemmatimonadales bacterium]|nr:hypothetical protein [Gemmatimonadales bacterium]
MKHAPDPIVAVQLTAGSGTTTILAQCPHCGKQLRLVGEHPQAKVELYRVDPDDKQPAS